MTSRWEDLTGGTTGREYAARFEALAASGQDLHGEATFCESLLPPGAGVLDAGCGTGRVAVRLAARGFRCVGVDADRSMLDVARESEADVAWVTADLTHLPPAVTDRAFDLVLLAGNVVPLLAGGTLAATLAALADLLVPDGLLVAGFGLDDQHLPCGCPVTPLADYEAGCDAAGLTARARHSSWDGEAWDPDAGYVVSVRARERRETA